MRWLNAHGCIAATDCKKEVEEDKINEQEIQLKDSLNDSNNDDFSDGISIISESESVGRISPHPYLRDHLHDLNFKFSLSDHMDDSILNKLREEMENETTTPLVVQQTPEPIAEQQLRQRRRSSTAATDSQALQKASQTVATTSGFAPLVKRGLQGIFYVGVGLAILALIGKIVHPTWQPLASVGSSSGSPGELEQKVNDMELQNNLMRAEIDLLNKQVKYLSTLNDPQQTQQQKQAKYKDSKTFKAWTGNGDSLKPVDITKQDLRRPYKCPDGSFVEIANMCMEQSSSNEPSIVDQFGHVVNDLKEQSEAFKTFEKVAEELQGFQDNPFEQLQDVFTDQVPTEAKRKEFIKNKPIYQATEDYKQNLPPTEKYQKYQTTTEDAYTPKPHKHSKYDDSSKTNKEYKKSYGKDENKSNNEFKKHHHNPDNSRDNSKERKEWKSDKYNNNSKEKQYRKDYSKELYNKDFDDSKENSPENHSKERYNKQKRNSGQWQEKYMKHREQLRNENEQKYQDNKNWYIKRGDSREHKRSGEKQYR
ncbi:myb-like protein X [Calliphora vicina]|uniref:myb-like protein X n=1 Tax=Calliphora vicina TaxID=7373 RepID=UPI00325BDA56